MLSILEKNQEYSPRCTTNACLEDGAAEGGDDEDSDEKILLQGILLDGDQLSCSMARRAIADRINSKDNEQCLKGLVPVVEDWHSKLCLLTVSCASYACTHVVYV